MGRRRKKKVSAEEMARLLARLEWGRVAKKRGPGDWLALVMGIPGQAVRVQVAGIVWWDFFAMRNVPDRWVELDEVLDDWRAARGVDPEKVRAELVRLGWPENMARKRIQALYLRYED